MPPWKTNIFFNYFFVFLLFLCLKYLFSFIYSKQIQIQIFYLFMEFFLLKKEVFLSLSFPLSLCKMHLKFVFLVLLIFWVAFKRIWKLKRKYENIHMYTYKHIYIICIFVFKHIKFQVILANIWSTKSNNQKPKPKPKPKTKNPLELWERN